MLINKAAYAGDIVSRLRNWRGLHLAHGGRLYDEAADEIERLRAGALDRRETVQQEPVAWAAMYQNGSVAWTGHSKEECLMGAPESAVVPLYRQPTLTDEEREAVEVAMHRCDTPHYATLRKLLERLK
jgi:hypothetical protein